LGDVKLLVVGKGDFGEEEKLKDLASEEGVKDLLVFAGWVKPDDIPKYLALGDVAIYPFDDTPLNRAKCPRKLVELMVAGKSVVAERVGQIAEYIKDDESGILVNHDDIKGFASAVVKVLKDSALKRSLGMNAQRRILEIFNWDRLVDGVERAISFSKKKDYIDEKKPYNALEIQRELELRIKNLLEENAPIEELQKAYDEFHSHLLKHGIRGRPPQGYLYKRNPSLIDQLFLEKIGRGKSVLEIGPGDGHFLIACARKGNLASGIDISNVVIQRLIAMFEREAMNAQIELGEARSLAFPKETFDFVVSKDLIEHLPETNLQAHLRETWRVLTSDGCYLLWTPSRLLGHTSLGAHLKEYTLSEIIQELKKAKFRPIIMNLPIFLIFGSIKEISNPHVTVFLLEYEKILERLFHILRVQIQNPIIYLVVPPICIAAFKVESQTNFKEPDN
jgi:2-polyprenyl-3-methyl-5-hydroxy-6-metoxy-1,4-benzoquinol methylase